MYGAAVSQLRELEIADVQDLLSDLSSSFGESDLLWYRGQARADWKLQPSLARREGLGMELELFAEFKRDATPLLAGADLRGGDLSEWDWLFLMQHYGIPTRLLDWSESPLSAVFFALDETGITAPVGDACVWLLKPQELNRAARLTITQPWFVPLCGESVEADYYLPSQVPIGSRNLEPMAISATRRFDRIRAQTGVFTVMHRDPMPLEESAPHALVRYVIPHAAKDGIRKQLRRLNLHASTMYPDLEHLGRRIAELLS